MIIFVKPQKMGVSHPICEVSLKKWGLYISYRQAQDGRQLCNKPTKEEDKPKKMDYIIIVCNQCFGYPLIKVTTAVTNNTLQAS